LLLRSEAPDFILSPNPSNNFLVLVASGSGALSAVVISPFATRSATVCFGVLYLPPPRSLCP
jgi:hypothetical protein